MKGNKGITLIALVITIIIMLILAGVSIGLVFNGGLIDYAKRAKTETEQQIQDEQEQMLQAEYEMEKITGKTETEIYSEYLLEKTYGKHTIGEETRGIRIGEEIAGYDCVEGVDQDLLTYTAVAESEDENELTTGNTNANGGDDLDQTFSVSENPTWKVLGIENGQILITTAEPIATMLILGGQEGYINGTGILNEIGAIYGHGALADTTKYETSEGRSGGRSITVEDINNVTGYKPATETKWKYKKDTNQSPYIQYSTDNGTTWNDINTSAEDFTYYNTQTNEFEPLEDGDEGELTYTFYTYNLIDPYAYKKEFISNSGAYRFWLASPYVNCSSRDADFGLRAVEAFMRRPCVYAYILYDFVDYPSLGRYGVRPVVSLSSNIQLSVVEGVWTISAKP